MIKEKKLGFFWLANNNKKTHTQIKQGKRKLQIGTYVIYAQQARLMMNIYIICRHHH